MLKYLSAYFMALFFCASCLQAQGLTGYSLLKTALTPDVSHPDRYTYEWIAANHTPAAGSFRIIDHLSGGDELFSVTAQDGMTPDPAAQPILPGMGPAAVTLGPFPIAAGSSVTFRVSGSRAPGSVPETFAILGQPAGASADSVGVSFGGDTPTPEGRTTVTAAPNVSTGDSPIRFLFDLTSPAHVWLTLYTISGERVYDADEEAGAGTGALIWTLDNNGRQK
ncbi:MAG TPA: hypothetical protein VFR02_03950, partial [bacterium]|nr:hypothetical protein [bacterium]